MILKLRLLFLLLASAAAFTTPALAGEVVELRQGGNPVKASSGFLFNRGESEDGSLVLNCTWPDGSKSRYTGDSSPAGNSIHCYLDEEGKQLWVATGQYLHFYCWADINKSDVFPVTREMLTKLAPEKFRNHLIKVRKLP